MSDEAARRDARDVPVARDVREAWMWAAIVLAWMVIAILEVKEVRCGFCSF